MERIELFKKIEELPADRLAEVEHFVELLTRKTYHPDRNDVYQALTDYANKHAGTPVDLDPEFEAESTKHLLQDDSPQ